MYCGAVEFVCSPSMIKHVPVLLEESLSYLGVEDGGQYADLLHTEEVGIRVLFLPQIRRMS